MSAWMQTTSGRAIDLLAIDLSRIDVATDVAGPLAAIARFAGQGRPPGPSDRVGGPISVAQHCVLGADALLDETGSATIALAFLLHDAHEAFLGDVTTPTVRALEAHLARVLEHAFGWTAPETVRAAIGNDPLRLAIDGLKAALDAKIHALAGLPARLPPPIAEAVVEMDRRMLDAERRMRLGRVIDPIGAAIWPTAVTDCRPVRLRGPITPWPRKRAANEWMTRFEDWRLTRPAFPTPNCHRETA